MASNHKVDPNSVLADAETVKYLSESQVQAFFARIKGIRDRAIFRLMYHRGLRASEPGLLRLEDWEPAEGILFVRRLKGSRSARYTLVSVEASALRAWLKIRGTRSGPLFPSRKRGPISRDQVHHLMVGYCLRAGIPRVLAHPHALKHACGTHLLARVGDLTVVQDHLGHRSIKSTEIYAKLLNRDRIAAKLKDWK